GVDPSAQKKQRAKKKRTERKSKNAEVPVDDNEAPAENVENVEVIEGEEVQQDFDGEQVEEDVEIKGEEQVEEEVKFVGNQERKRLQWNIQDHGVEPSGHLPYYELIHPQVEFASSTSSKFQIS
ncbi:hypothetical protein Dimus_035304, partial [Dionaea muscipula]